jgi:hypothetical protein
VKNASPELRPDLMPKAATNSSRDRTLVERRPSKQRSRISNGRCYFIEGDERSAWSRRWRDVLGEVLSDLGDDGLSEGERQLARRCATIAIACEKMEGEAAQGREIDLETFGQLTDRLGRCLARLGIKKRCHALRDVTPTVSEYLQHVNKQSQAAS